MFGYYDVPFRAEKKGISISVEREGENLVYKRAFGGEQVEKTLLSNKCKVIINPVEPLSRPENIPYYLLIEFDKRVMIAPKTTKKVFVKSPIDIGMFISGKKDFELLDVVSLMKQKLTLYGSVTKGFLCRYWKSGVYSKIPDVTPLEEGVVDLRIMNISDEWIEISKVVFNAYEMKIYYDDKLVSMKARMKLHDKLVADTDFIESPLKEGMEKSLEVYKVRKKLTVIPTKFEMEEGV